jgi:hypothetical protein
MIDGNPVVVLVSQFGKIKNCRIAPSFSESSESILCYPPSVIWSYQDTETENDISVLAQKIAEFSGNFKWIMRRERDCWMLYPSFLEEISQQRNENLRDSSAFVMKDKPELGVKSNLEFRELITFLLQEILG